MKDAGAYGSYVRDHAGEKKKELLKAQSIREITQPYFPFVNKAGPSNVRATLSRWSSVKAFLVNTGASAFANGEANAGIRLEPQRCWLSWEI